MPPVRPPKGIPEYHSDQSKHEHLPSVPIRAVIAGPSGCGKTLLIVTMITDLYRKNDGKSVFKRVYVFSPSVHVDPAWLPVKKFVEDELKVPKAEQWAWDHYDPLALEQLIATQKEVIAVAKQEKVRRMFNILVVVDDFADNAAFSRRDALLHSLFTRGRHAFISTICATQKFRALSNIIRVNATALIVFRLRSEAELQAIVEEISAVYGKDTLIALIRHATEQPYSFLYCDLAAKKPDQMFWLRFEKRLVPRDFDSDNGASASDG
jgi:GTPase SAR1 family protein